MFQQLQFKFTRLYPISFCLDTYQAALLFIAQTGKNMHRYNHSFSRTSLCIKRDVFQNKKRRKILCDVKHTHQLLAVGNEPVSF